ncbi:hypothetical protein BTR23_01570 [Alkalihalophilus pseudofirmus]|nr:hypothetical protein BTR23_01570 [Alkalihalophilus pseudofirmus]
MLKPIVSTMFLMTMGASLIACGGQDTSTTPSNNDNSENTQTGESITLRASSGVGAEHTWNTGFTYSLMERVESQSAGDVSFEIFTSGELVPLGTEYDALRQGTIDVALSLMGPYDPQRFPYSEVAMLPLLESDAKIASTAMQNMMKSDRVIADGKTYYELEFADKGLVAFANPLTEPYVISTTRQKLESISDFTESLRMRSPSRVHEILATNLGVTAISMPVTDSYDALSRNALDGMFHSIPDWANFGLDELFRHTIEGANLGHFIGHTAMTQETWDSLPADVQEEFEAAADEIIFDGSDQWIDGTVRGKEANIEKGGEFTHLDDLNPEVRDHINNAIVETWFEWIDNLESQQLAGKEMALLWRDMLVEAGAVLPDEIVELQ